MWLLFISFFMIGLLGFGGGLSILPLFLSTLLKNDWMSENEFWSVVGTTQSLPGIVSVNLSAILGYKINGFLGSVVATIGFVLPSIVVITLLSIILSKYKDVKWLKKMMLYIKLVPIYLLGVTLIKLVQRVYTGIIINDLIALAIFITYIYIIIKTKYNVIYIALVFGIIYTATQNKI